MHRRRFSPLLTFAAPLAALAMIAAPAAPAGAQGGVPRGGSPGGLRVRVHIDCDSCTDSTSATMLPRRHAELLIRLDTLMHRFEEEPFGSASRSELERQVTAAVRALQAASGEMHGAFVGPEFGARTMFNATVAAKLAPRGWIGLNLDGPHELFLRTDGEYIRYFDYPEVISVEPNSPAEQAGLQRGDLVLAYNGSDLRTHRINVTRMFEPQKRVAVAVRRDGEPHEYTVTVARAPQQFARERFELRPGPVEGPGMPMPPEMAGGVMFTRPAMPAMPSGAMLIAPNGVFGAAMSTVGADLATALGLSRGVLVTDAPAGTPAARAGLHAGDVIVRVEGRPVSNVAELRAAVMRGIGDDAVALDVMRGKKARKLTVRW